MMTNTRPALSTHIRTAATEIGMSVVVVVDPTGMGRLMYSIQGSKALTPGEAATLLGVA